jgi:hypothetical protein
MSTRRLNLECIVCERIVVIAQEYVDEKEILTTSLEGASVNSNGTVLCSKRCEEELRRIQPTGKPPKRTHAAKGDTRRITAPTTTLIDEAILSCEIMKVIFTGHHRDKWAGLKPENFGSCIGRIRRIDDAWICVHSPELDLNLMRETIVNVIPIG